MLTFLWLVYDFPWHQSFVFLLKRLSTAGVDNLPKEGHMRNWDCFLCGLTLIWTFYNLLDCPSRIVPNVTPLGRLTTHPWSTTYNVPYPFIHTHIYTWFNDVREPPKNHPMYTVNFYNGDLLYLLLILIRRRLMMLFNVKLERIFIGRFML